MLDDDQRYLAVRSRDVRFDGWFVTAVRTTGIYCRPSCPAITPKRANVEFHPTAAAAQQRGFRACKRCRPDASPGSPEWNVRSDVVARAMRLIGDGAVDRHGVAGLAQLLGYSERHLTRLMNDELGAGPLAIARAQRAHTARLLVETTDMAVTDVAFAAGFGSVRQFNDTMRAVFGATPSALRAATRRGAPRAGRDGTPPTECHGKPGEVALRLPVRRPFAGTGVLAFVGERAIPGVESWDGTTYRRALRLDGGPAVVTLRLGGDGTAHVDARLRLTAWSDLPAAVQRVRRLLDLDADPVAVDAHLGADPALAPLVARTPGLRVPSSVDPYETAVRAIVGQQVSVTGARTVIARLVAGVASDDGDAPSGSLRPFPSPEQLADAPDRAFSMPAARRDTIRALAADVADGTLDLHVGAEPGDVRRRLLERRGIGPWTADYVVLRGLGHPDVFLAGDLGVRRALDALGADASAASRWSPWRSYAVHHLWASPAPPSPEGATP